MLVAKEINRKRRNFNPKSHQIGESKILNPKLRKSLKGLNNPQTLFEGKNKLDPTLMEIIRENLRKKSPTIIWVGNLKTPSSILGPTERGEPPGKRKFLMKTPLRDPGN